jgi:hypothetical protein
MARGQMGRKRYQELYDQRQKEIELYNLRYNAAVTLQCMHRMRTARNEVRELKRKQSLKQSFFGEQSEAVKLLREQQKAAALKADKAAAIVVQQKKDRRKEVEALQKNLEGANEAAARAKMAEEEVARLSLEAEMLRKEMEVFRIENEQMKARLEVVEAENKTLKAKVESGSFLDGYKSVQFDDYTDLKQLDERIHNMALRSMQGRKELDALVQSLAILR